MCGSREERGTTNDQKLQVPENGFMLLFTTFPMLSVSSKVRSPLIHYHTSSPNNFSNLPFQGAMGRERKLLLDSVLFKQKEMVSEPQKTNKHASTWNFTSVCLLSGTKRRALK